MQRTRSRSKIQWKDCPMKNFSKEILASCLQVVHSDQAFITIADDAAMTKCSQKLRKLIKSINSSCSNEFAPLHHEDLVDWIFACDLVNFCFWSSSVVELNGKKYTGYFSLLATIKKAELNGFSVWDWNMIISADDEYISERLFNSNFPMITERIKVLKEAASVLIKVMCS